MASASDHRAHAALQPADRLILLPQRLPAAVETSIGPAHYPAECTQSDAFLQPSLRARKGRANSNSLAFNAVRYADDNQSAEITKLLGILVARVRSDPGSLRSFFGLSLLPLGAEHAAYLE